MTRLQNGSFGNSFPEQCPDGHGVIGHDSALLEASLLGDGLVWPVEKDVVPDTHAVLDLLEFCHVNVAKPEADGYHSFFRHSHLSFHVETGRAEFRDAVNRVFARNSIAFELQSNGQVERLGPAVLTPALQKTTFHTSDRTLDLLLETARAKFLDPKLNVRKESLEKLWDAFERLKTLEGGSKKASISALLAKGVKNVGNHLKTRKSEQCRRPLSGRRSCLPARAQAGSRP